MGVLQFVLAVGLAYSFAGADELYQGFTASAINNLADDDSNCKNHMHKFYRKMRCEQEKRPGSTCPTSYNCPALTARSKDHCYHEGLKYPIGTNITRSTVDFHTSCIESCQCVRLYEGVRFVCIQESNNFTCPGADGCQRFAFVEDFPCCQDGVKSCNNGKKDSVKCIYEGLSYSEGEKIIASQDPTCTQCICASGFNGTISPNFCRKLSCALEFWGNAPIMLSRGCIPLFLSEEGCCPVAFRCPEPTDRVIKQKSLGSAKDQTVKRCVFGNLTLEVGDSLSAWQLKNGRDVECSCRIPPWPSCVAKNFVLSKIVRMELAREGL